MRPVTILTGCTATGKTEVAAMLARRIRTEVVSADSRQVYRHMDIGTAKPPRVLREAVPHHLVDIVDPDGCYSAGEFSREALRLIPDIRGRGAVPLVVGGTGLYLSALTGPFDDLPPAHPALRRTLSACGAASPGFLARMLRRLDPGSACTTGPDDVVRIVRAVEITLLTGRRASQLRRGATGPGLWRVVRMDLPLPELRRRIETRISGMFDEGLAAEVAWLAGRGWGRDAAPGRTIGYREILDAVEAGRPPAEAAGRIVSGTWRYARRQRNMLGRLPAARVVDGADPCGVVSTLLELEEGNAEG